MALNASILSGWALPFDLMIDFFRKKKIVISPDSWRDITGDAHNQAFTVAQVIAADVLLDIQNSLIESMEAGETLKQWKEKIRPTLRAKGWLPETASEDRKPLPGHRLSNIWLTNISSANNAGRWKQQQKLSARRPFWEYMNPDDESTTEDICKPLSGKVFRADNPIWKKWYPPNHFRCRSTVRSLRQKDIDRRGLTVSRKLPEGVEPAEGFDHDPSSGWEPDLKKYPGPLRKQVETALTESKKRKGKKLPSLIDARKSYSEGIAWIDLQYKEDTYEKAFKESQKAFMDYVAVMNSLSDFKLQQERKKIIAQMLVNMPKTYIQYIIKGVEHIPNDMLLDLHRAGVKIYMDKKNRRPVYSPSRRRVVMGLDDGADTIAHELGHAIDDTLLSGYGKLKGRNKMCDWKNNSPYIPKGMKKKYQDMYDYNKTGKKGTYKNGDGEYYKGDWVDDYEGRIYPNSEDGIEFFSMASERYRLFKSFKDGGEEALKLSKWGDQKELYPEFASFIEDFYEGKGKDWKLKPKTEDKYTPQDSLRAVKAIAEKDYGVELINFKNKNLPDANRYLKELHSFGLKSIIKIRHVADLEKPSVSTLTRGFILNIPEGKTLTKLEFRSLLRQAKKREPMREKLKWGE